MNAARSTHAKDQAVQAAKTGRNGALRFPVPFKASVKRLLYRLYTHRLRARTAGGPVPRHIAVVLDGNRRFATQHGYGDTAVGYVLGTERVDDLLRWSDQLDIPVVTVWILSIDNLQRHGEDLDSLIAVLEERLPHLRSLQGTLKHPRRIKACGRTEILPDGLQETIRRVERETAGHGPYTLYVAIGYGGREEIVDAVKKHLRREASSGKSLNAVAEGITPQDIGRHLYFNGSPDPDLIIRTSGEIRLSGFMLWESVYSEYYFCDALWPEFREMDFLRAIRSYQDRHRRFGQ